MNMNRRQFLGTSAATVASVALAQAARAVEASPRLWIEVRNYHFATSEQTKSFAGLMAKAGIGAMNRAGAKPVGLFRLDPKDNSKLEDKGDPNDLWMVIPHDSADDFAQFENRLGADDAYQSSAKDVLGGDKDHPPFKRYDTLLLHAFASTPSMTPQELKDDRVLELRTYQSRNPERAANKIGMFEAGEIPIFTRAGMPGVFFGGAIAGWDLPNLTYMVWHENMNSAKEHWATFQADEDWKKLRSQPQYKDNVSKIIDRFLRPMPGSQI
jgi:hypothetical protein